MVGMTKFNYVGYDLALDVTFDQLEAAIRVQGGPNVEALLGTLVPKTPGGRLSVGQDTTSHWSKRGLVEVIRSIEELPRRDPRVEGSLSQKIESELSLWTDEVLMVRGRMDPLRPRWKGSGP